METAKAIETLKALEDRELYHALQTLMEGRQFAYSEATDQHHQPTPTAKLAVVKHVLTAI